jgi:cell division cycle 2-like protein
MEASGSLTPSKKRSKWVAEGGSEEVELPVQQKRVKTVASKPPITSVERQPSKPVSRQSQSHSSFVPPRTKHPPIIPSRSVYSYERLNQIEEGSYGVVYRARDKQTGSIVALKKLKLDEEKSGFPITALREVNSLMTCRHENVVGIREVVVGDTLTQ